MLIYPKIGLMNLLVLLLLIPLSFADAPTCKELGPILENYEKDFAGSRLDCNAIKPEELTQGHPELPIDDYFKNRMCRSLGAIEGELERLRAELSVADGLKKLKASVAETQAAGGKSKQDGMKFITTLDAAVTIEALLNTTTAKNEPFLLLIKNFSDETRSDPKLFREQIKKLCKDHKKDEANACNDNFNPEDLSLGEVNAMLSTTNDITKKQIEDWKSLMSIQREDKSTYSFAQMKQELGAKFEQIDRILEAKRKKKAETVPEKKYLAADEFLTRDHLNAIKQLDKFQHTPDFYGKEILSIKNQPAVQADKYLLLLGDAMARQEYEAKSKLSVAFQNYRNQLKLEPSQISDCEIAKTDTNKAFACQEHMRVASLNMQDGDLKAAILPGILNSLNYSKKLGELADKCGLDIQKGKTIPDACLEELSEPTNDLQQKIRQLNILKDKLGSQQQEKMKYRNFALKLWTDKCKPEETLVDCEATDGLTNAYLAISDTMKITMVYTPQPVVETEVKELCDEGKSKGKKFRVDVEEKLCETFKSKQPTPGTVTPPKEDDLPKPSPKLDLEGQANRDRAIMAGKNLLTDALKSWISYKYPQNGMPYNTNPYPYNYSPYNYGQPPMGIADSIMFNARYYGSYGYYMPTPGYQPYTAFGSTSTMSAYSPAAVKYPSAYFSK